jgi:hypothetical protein
MPGFCSTLAISFTVRCFRRKGAFENGAKRLGQISLFRTLETCDGAHTEDLPGSCKCNNVHHEMKYEHHHIMFVV